MARLEINTYPESVLLARLFADCYNSLSALKDLRYDCENQFSGGGGTESVPIDCQDRDTLILMDGFPRSVSSEASMVISRANLIDLVNQWIQWLNDRKLHPDQDIFSLK
jgi:hypothetical protein